MPRVCTTYEMQLGYFRLHGEPVPPGSRSLRVGVANPAFGDEVVNAPCIRMPRIQIFCRSNTWMVRVYVHARTRVLDDRCVQRFVITHCVSVGGCGG